MEEESLLSTLFDEENFEDGGDIEMLDVEEGELVEPVSKTGARKSPDCSDLQVNQETGRKKTRNKKKNKQRRSKSTGPSVTNVNRFVMDVCKRLREKKHYLMWTAVGCLGISALSDLIKEVDAIQACGGQKTANGSRFRNGGGILWNIIKAREPNAYKEIMKKGREFEKQFKQQVVSKQQAEAPLRSNERARCNQTDGPDGFGQSNGEQKCASVHDRLRAPVIYDDLFPEARPGVTDA